MPSKLSKVIRRSKIFFNKVKRNFNNFMRPDQRARFIFCKYYEKTQVSDNIIFIEAFNGDEISGNPFYLLRQICSDERFDDYEIYVGSVKDQMGNIRHRLDANGFENVTVLQRHTKKFCKVIATARYIISDVTLPAYFIKKEGQIYLNTWHGTPLKGLGRSILDAPNSIGNVQRNFLMTDYLLSPNVYTFEKLRDDYMITSFYKGKYILSGYPRNEILFDSKKAKKLKRKLGLANKKIVIYMPTWREKDPNDTEDVHLNTLLKVLRTLDKKVSDDTVVIAKLHHLTGGSIDFSKYKKVLPFPNEYETYEVLAMADCLITDYSSVMFDYANTGRKIILYTYDCEEYQNTRSMYTSVETLPFVITTELKALVREVNSLDKYEDYSEKIHHFIEYDNAHASKDLIEYVFFGEQAEGMKVIDGSEYHNGKENVIIFAGSLLKNGITAALKSLTSVIDADKRNYSLLFYAGAVNKNRMTIHEFSRYSYFPIQGARIMTYGEAFCQFLYYFFSLDTKYIRHKLQAIYEREIQRLFAGTKFDYFIHYSGYERNIMSLMINMDCKKAVYIHNNLIKESNVRDNIHVKSVEECYEKCDKLVAIREGMREELLFSNESIREKVCLAHNPIDYHQVLERAKMPLSLDEDTESTVSVGELARVLDDQSVTKFINIARFSPEKGLDRLIDAFEMTNQKHSKSKLIIIGGHGALYEQILNKAKESVCSKDIIIIKSLSNVFPVLTRCSAFVLSSYYEGLPVTIMEALVLGKTVISTDIVGPRAFLSKGYGHLVEESAEAISDGMCQFIEGTLPETKFFDAQEFNDNAIKEFEAVFED